MLSPYLDMLNFEVPVKYPESLGRLSGTATRPLSADTPTKKLKFRQVKELQHSAFLSKVPAAKIQGPQGLSRDLPDSKFTS